MGRPASPFPRITFRLPEGLRDRIESRALKNNRSVNAEIVSALEYAFDEHDLSADIDRVQEESNRRLDEMQKTLDDGLAALGATPEDFKLLIDSLRKSATKD